MAEDTATINDAGESSTPQPQPVSQGELVSTVEFQPSTMNADTDPEGANNTGADEKTAESKKADAAKPDGDSFETRFDKHPRFVELNKRVKSAEENNRQLLERLAKIEAEKTAATKAADKDESLPYKDISKMSEDELLDWQTSDPKGYAENQIKLINHLAKTNMEEYKAMSAEQARKEEFEAKIDQTYSAYAKENPDFDEMWDAGEISAYMDSHPGHNPLSAHMAMTAETRMQARIDEAVKQALEKAETEQRSKRATRSIIGSGPSRMPTPTSDAELKDPKKYGGITAVLAARHEARRRAAGTM